MLGVYAPRPELHREDPPAPEGRPLQQLKVPVIEALPDIDGEAVERLPVHPLDHPTPALDHDGRRR